MATESYGRAVELFVDGKRFNGDDFTILFSVPFDDGGDANVAEVKVYNLKNDTINGFKKDSRIILNAGYRGDAGAILLGVVKSVKSDWSGVDRITTIQVLDGTDAWFSARVKKTYKAGSNGEAILKDLSKITGLQIGAFKLPKPVTYKSGKTLNGTLANVIKQIAAENGAKAHVTRGKVYIRPKSEGDNIGFVLDADHGLISSPTPVEKEVETSEKDKDGNKKKVKRQGWTVKCLLNHKITTDALIRISSKTANGTFRVESGQHDGGSFETEMEVYPA